jgi:hypothetical protein
MNLIKETEGRDRRPNMRGGGRQRREMKTRREEK